MRCVQPTSEAGRRKCVRVHSEQADCWGGVRTTLTAGRLGGVGTAPDALSRVSKRKEEREREREGDIDGGREIGRREFWVVSEALVRPACVGAPVVD